MHWRKFEELTAEYFKRDGYNVELGPGSNDDGVDVRVWKASQDEENDPPHIIIQCKRQKSKVEKVVVKGLYADMLFQKADYGLIVTSSELSPGSKQTIIARGYAIEEIDNKGLRTWLETLQTPGTGIVRV
jgi:restriction system protein